MDSIEILKQFISTDLLADQPDLDLGANDDLLISGLVDSLGVMRLVDFIEEKFGVDVPPEDVTIENFQSISLIAAYLATRPQVAS